MVDALVVMAKDELEGILAEYGEMKAILEPDVAHVIDVDWGETYLLGDIEVVSPTVRYYSKCCLVCATEFDAYEGICDCE